MPESEEWPSKKNTIADREHLAAIGQFALIYNYAEGVVGHLFESCFHGTGDYSKALFQRLNNRERVDMLRAIIKFDEKDPDVQGRLLDALRYYDICTDNRNIIMHGVADSDTNANKEIIRLANRVRKKPDDTNWYQLSLDEMRQLADDCTRTFIFLSQIFGWLRKREDKEQLPPLPDIPPQPRKLIPSEHVPAS